jgi:hypothetical protein
MPRPNYRYRFSYSEGYGQWEEIYVDPSWFRTEAGLRDYFDEIERSEGPRLAPRWSGFYYEPIVYPEPTLKWLLETETFEDDVMKALQDAIVANGMEFKLLDFHSWEDDKQFTKKYGPHECVMFYGSLGAAQRIQRATKWVPGTWLNLRNFECTQYYNHFGRFLLNSEYVMLPFGELRRQKDFLFSVFGSTGKFFIRPNSGLKLFTGSVVHYETWEKDYELLGFYEPDPHQLVVVSKPQKIHKEWRLMVVGGKVVSGSLYNTAGQLEPEAGFPDDVGAFGDEIAKIWQPDPAWTLDVALTDAGLKLIEINSFSCSGMYLCDKMPLVKAVSDLAIQEWREFQ